MERVATENIALAIWSVAAFGAGCCWCFDFSHTVHTTSKQMFQTLLVKEKVDGAHS